jgi:predicted RNase H-like nuclease (RuvC/YqgF family)
MKKQLDTLKEDLKKKESFIELLKSFQSLESEGYVPLLEVKEIRDSTIRDLNETFDLEKKVIFAENIDNAQILNDYRIKTLITPMEPSKNVIEKVDFQIIIKKDISIKKVKNVLVVSRDELENRLKDIKKTGLVQWLELYKKRKL